MVKHSLFFALCLAMILPACAPKPIIVPTATATPTALATPTATAAPTPVSPFNYDPSVPFDTKINSQAEQDGVTVTELSYAAHTPTFAINMGGRTVAILVSPKGSGPFAGIVYMHWSDPSETGSGNRREYLNEAVTMAQHGAISLLPMGFFPWSSAPTGTLGDRALYIGQVIELRRAFDFLLAQPGVDPHRLGYVGHGFGAVYGGVLAGVDKHAKTYILIGGTSGFVDLNCGCFGTMSAQYRTYFKDIDPINFIPNAAPASIFFQFGKNDYSVTESQANQYYEAASQPKQIEWYDDIEMHTDPVVKAHQAWLIEKLSLAP